MASDLITRLMTFRYISIPPPLARPAAGRGAFLLHATQTIVFF